MTPRLKELLEKRKAKADTQTETKTQEITADDTPAIILVPAFDIPMRDEYSEYF